MGDLELIMDTVFVNPVTNIFRNTRSFENWTISSPSIRSCDAFRAITYERKYLMNYNYRYCRVVVCKVENDSSIKCDVTVSDQPPAHRGIPLLLIFSHLTHAYGR